MMFSNDPVQKLSDKTGKSVRTLFEEHYHNPDISFDHFQAYCFDQDTEECMEVWCRQQLVALKEKAA